jgi:elongation factor G
MVMVLSASVHGQRRLLGLLVLKNAQLTRQSSIASFCAAVRSYSSEHAHHDARIENVRNIGIIAHVDAVRPAVLDWLD